jgi:hypothetical protein
VSERGRIKDEGLPVYKKEDNDKGREKYGGWNKNRIRYREGEK